MVCVVRVRVPAQGVAKAWLESQPRTTIETETPGYLHAKSLSLLFGFPDSVGVSLAFLFGFVGSAGGGGGVVLAGLWV